MYCSYIKDLHPEDTDTGLQDIEITTVETIFVNREYNDLSFTVRDKLVCLVEAQSIWDDNITYRMLVYLVTAYRDFIDHTRQKVHGFSKLYLPFPECYLVFTGEGECPEIVSFAEVFYGGNAPIDLRIKVFREASTETLYGQYVGLSKTYDENKKIYGSSIECARETIRICKEKGYLVPFILKYEREVITMMSELFDAERMRREYEEEIREIATAEGRKEGMEKGMEKERDAFIKCLKKFGMDDDKIKEIVALREQTPTA